MPWPRKTSTCRSFVTISSGLCRLFAIVLLLHGQNHTSRWTRSMGVDHPGFVRLAFDATPEERRATKIHKALCNLFVPGWGDAPFYKAKVKDTDERAEKGLRI